ncbi:MAG: energy transducer TonB [Chloroherpetonaceae bacterium]
MKHTYLSLVKTFASIAICFVLSGCSGCSGCKNQSDIDLKHAQDLAAVEEQRRRDSIDAVRRYEAALAEKKRKDDSLAAIKAKEDAKARADTLPPEIAGKVVKREMPVDIDKMSESTADLEDELRPTIEAARRRMDGVRGYISFKLVVLPSGRVKEIKWEHNDLDAQAMQAIQATVYRHRYPSWDGSKLPEYLTPTIKFSF